MVNNYFDYCGIYLSFRYWQLLIREWNRLNCLIFLAIIMERIPVLKCWRSIIRSWCSLLLPGNIMCSTPCYVWSMDVMWLWRLRADFVWMSMPRWLSRQNVVAVMYILWKTHFLHVRILQFSIWWMKDCWVRLFLCVVDIGMICVDCCWMMRVILVIVKKPKVFGEVNIIWKKMETFIRHTDWLLFVWLPALIEKTGLNIWHRFHPNLPECCNGLRNWVEIQMSRYVWEMLL